MEIINSVIDICAILVLLVLIIAIIGEIKYRESGTISFLLCLISILFAILFDMTIFLLDTEVRSIVIVNILFILSYIFIAMAIVFFTDYMVINLNKTVYVSRDIVTFIAFWAFVCCLAYIIMTINGKAILLDQNGLITHSDNYYITQILPLIALLTDGMIILSCRRSFEKKYLFTWLMFVLIPSISLIFGIFFEVSYFNFILSISTLLIYINIHTEQNVKIAEKDAEITESRMKVMLSQIQPHFMYNTLNSIYYLIEKDPEKAQNTLSTFSDYLRSNIKALGAEKPIDFELELKHIEAYLELEKIRFDEELEVFFDIKDTEFKVPSLAVQTLVENAVKHGISQKQGKGTIKVLSFEDKNFHNVVIKDDGVGMNVKELETKINSESTGIGIKTSRERIKLQCSGTVEVYSIVGKGTDIVIKIPKEVRQS